MTVWTSGASHRDGARPVAADGSRGARAAGAHAPGASPDASSVPASVVLARLARSAAARACSRMLDAGLPLARDAEEVLPPPPDLDVPSSALRSRFFPPPWFTIVASGRA